MHIRFFFLLNTRFNLYKSNKNQAPTHGIFSCKYSYTSKKQYIFVYIKLLQKREMRKDIVIELSYKGFG